MKEKYKIKSLHHSQISMSISIPMAIWYIRSNMLNRIQGNNPIYMGHPCQYKLLRIHSISIHLYVRAAHNPYSHNKFKIKLILTYIRSPILMIGVLYLPCMERIFLLLFLSDLSIIYLSSIYEIYVFVVHLIYGYNIYFAFLSLIQDIFDM